MYCSPAPVYNFSSCTIFTYYLHQHSHTQTPACLFVEYFLNFLKHLKTSVHPYMYIVSSIGSQMTYTLMRKLFDAAVCTSFEMCRLTQQPAVAQRFGWHTHTHTHTHRGQAAVAMINRVKVINMLWISWGPGKAEPLAKGLRSDWSAAVCVGEAPPQMTSQGSAEELSWPLIPCWEDDGKVVVLACT